MANLNSVMLIGRLTRDPEPIPVGNGGAKFSFAVTNRKFDNATKQWQDDPVFLDCEIWNRGENKQADRVLETLRKGQQVFIEGHLKYETWDDRNGGGKRNKVSVVVDGFQYLEPRASEPDDAPREAPSQARRPATTRAPAPPVARPATRRPADLDGCDDPTRNGTAHDEDKIPF